jgi:hypothetical protein
MAGDSPPNWAGRLGQAVFVGSLIFTAVLLALALAGVSDPKPAGPLRLDDPLDADAGWLPLDENGSWVRVEGGFRLAVEGPARMALIQSPYTIQPPTTVEITARQLGGPPEAAYGLWWGSDPVTIVAVKGNGYYGVFTIDHASMVDSGDEIAYIVEWVPFPHVRPQGEANRLWVDFREGRAEVRINEDVAATFDSPADGPFRVGFAVETFREGGSSALLDRLRVWEGE